jgi:hypothetical protein
VSIRVFAERSRIPVAHYRFGNQGPAVRREGCWGLQKLVSDDGRFRRLLSSQRPGESAGSDDGSVHGQTVIATENEPDASMRSSLRSRVLVTGGAGFLGSHLCSRLLAEGNEVLWVDNFYTGTKDNIAGLAANSRLEFLLRGRTTPSHDPRTQACRFALDARALHGERERPS